MKRACTVPGCDRVRLARGLCNRHYIRMYRHGSATDGEPLERPTGMTPDELLDYELGRATRDGECLLTAAHRDRRGYGRVGVGGAKRLLHRLILERQEGRRLSQLELACHRCHRTSCINPAHLYVGSHADNMADSLAGGTHRAPTGTHNGAAKLTDADVRAIRERYAAGGIRQEDLAVEYGVDASTVGRIVRHNLWKEVA